ncbi:hypothetical protein WG908_14350 [Sphingobium sp. AN641]|uniref:HTH domain-containing protein n=1 Tax=Sphingobium sp. AN641 TaxID=3133443 RepID=UPI0030BA3F62
MVKVSRNPSDEHEFHTMGSRPFEHFVRALHEAQPSILTAYLYGPDGQGQFGADHIAPRNDGTADIEIGQSKAYRQFGQTAVREAADAFVDHWEAEWRSKQVKRFILFVGCAIKSRQAADEIVAQTQRFATLGVEFLVWDANAIYDRLSAAPHVVRTHLGQEWYEKLFGEPVGPLTGLQQDLQRGDMGAFRVAVYVSRLNQAESAEVIELRRRARRGEAAQVIDLLEATLFDHPAARATAPDVRAQQLRLLAGLLIHHGDYARVKTLLDEADTLDGDSARPRAVLALESLGPAIALAQIPIDAGAELSEVRAVARLRQQDSAAALAELKPHLEAEAPSAETLRLAALATLLGNDREAAVRHARRAVAKDGDSRACRQALAIALFYRALSPAAEVGTGEWPQPVDLPLVNESDQARQDLAEAETLFAKLTEGTDLSEHHTMVLWHFGTLACAPSRRDDALARIRTFEASAEGLPPPITAWAISRGFPFDQEAAARVCDAKIAADATDFESLLIRVALANFMHDVALGRTLLENGRAALEAAGHADLYTYWLAVLDMESHLSPSKDALKAHPWLKLRLALDIPKRKLRLKAITKVLQSSLANDGDARVILTASQFLLDGGWYNIAVKSAATLINQIGTAEAISIAAQALYRTGRYAEALAALDNLSAFPNGRLPVDLQRLRTECLAGSGEIMAAREASLAIARTSGQTGDLWRSIEYHLASGAASAALAFYDEHAEALGKPTPGHIHLARAVLHSDPNAAARIIRHVAADAPDELVTAAFDLACKLRLSDEQRVLVGRMQQLGTDGAGGVQLLTIDDIKEMIESRHEQVDRLLDQYQRGHAPVHVLAQIRPGALAAGYLGQLLDPPEPASRTLMLSARYGRRYSSDVWPADRAQVKLLADISALLTAHGLGLLDNVERAFRPIFIAPDTVNILSGMRSDIETSQPDYIAAAERVLDAFNDGDLLDQAAIDQIDTFTVLWDGDVGEPTATLNFSRLYEVFEAAVGSGERAAAIRASLGNTLELAPAGVSPPKGATLNLQFGMAQTLEECGALKPLLRHFVVALTMEDIVQMRSSVAEARMRDRLAKALSELLARVASGLEDGAYKVVPLQRDAMPNVVQRAFMQLVAAMSDGQSILWADDRFASSIDNPQFRVQTTVEVLDALLRYQRLSQPAVYDYRQALRRARWMFMPLTGEEIAHFLRPAVSKGVLTESTDLATLRRSVAEALQVRRMLQWPDAQAAEQGVRGEIPYLLDAGHAITGALAAIWNSRDWTIEDAEAASAWIIDNLEIELFPMPVLGAGDPRSDYLIGIHLAALMLTGLQILSLRAGKGKQKAYLDWIWNHLVREALRVRPEVRTSMEDMLEDHLGRNLLDDADEPAEQDSDQIWKSLVGDMINALPLALRSRMLDKPAIQKAFDILDHGQIGMEGYDFDEMVFWRAIAEGTPGIPTTIASLAGLDAQVEVTPLGEDQHVAMTIGGATMRLDAWPWRIAHEQLDIRRAALEERAEQFDLSSGELDCFAEELGAATPGAVRVRDALRRSHQSMAQWYADLASTIEQRRPVQLSDFAPENYSKVIAHLRLEPGDSDWNGPARRLMDARGLEAAIRRLSALPIAMPPAIQYALHALDEPALLALCDGLGGDGAPPWTKLFIARPLLERDTLSEDLRQRLTAWVTQLAADDDARLHWDIYAALARFAAGEGPAKAGWRDLDDRGQLAACWLHAGEVASRIIAGRVRADSLIEQLDAHRMVSPRQLIEESHKFSGDMADPRHVTTDRLMMFSLAPGLIELATCDAAAATEALAALLYEVEDGERTPRINVIHNGLATDNRLSSIFSADIGPGIDALHAGAATIFGDGLKSLISTFLAANPATKQHNAGWTYLRMASGESRLPSDLADEVRAKAANIDLADDSLGLLDARLLLHSVTTLAAINGWSDLAPAVDAAATALGPHRGLSDLDGPLLFEIGLLRARLESETLARTKTMAHELRRLGATAELREQAERAALHFSRGLSGQETEAFVDVLASFRAETP